MEKIDLISLRLRNFKGASDLPNACVEGKNLKIPFSEFTTISGDNATLKSTCFDAFSWLLHDKNSADDKDFSIKTLDRNNNAIPKIEHEVEGLLSVNGRHVKLRKVYKEKWVTKKGEPVAEWSGHTTEYYCDDVPLSQKEYKSRVDFLLKEDIAKLITNPLYFNQMPYKEKRMVLEAIAGHITNDQILNECILFRPGNTAGFTDLVKILTQNKTLDDYRREIAANKKKIKEYKDTIPTRIEEVKRSIPPQHDWTSIEQQIASKQVEIAAIETKMEENGNNHKAQHEANKSAFEEITKKEQELNDLRIALGKARVAGTSIRTNKLVEIDNLIQGFDGQIKNRNIQIGNIKNEIAMNIRTIQSNANKIISLQNESNKIREQWVTENAKSLVIDEHLFNCPTCKQLLPESERNTKRETLTSNFNIIKAETLKQLTQQGTSNNEIIGQREAITTALLETNRQMEARIATIEAEITTFTSERIAHQEQRKVTELAPVQESDEAQGLQQQIASFVIPTPPKEVVIDNTELKNQRTVISQAIDALKVQLAAKEQIERLTARVLELEKEEAAQAQQLADLEKIEFTIDAFSKAKIEAIESRINGKFKYVRFKMFNTLINGGTEECCECMLNGVPYADVNTAGKITCGIDIINALVDHYGISAPIWIDGRESIIRIPKCKSQIINLVVKKGAPLTITNSVEEEEFVSAE